MNRFFLLLCITLATSASGHPNETLIKQIQSVGNILLVQSFDATLGADQTYWKSGDFTKCDEQRALNARGIKDAEVFGKALANLNVTITRIDTSQYCRANNAANLILPKGRTSQHLKLNDICRESALNMQPI
jgi:hypothetical protein